MKSCASARRAARSTSASVGAGAADADVLGDRAVEEAGLLEDDGDAAAQRGERYVGDVVAVDQDAARRRAGAGAAAARARWSCRRRSGRPAPRSRRARPSKVEVEDALVAAGEAVGDVLVADRAGRCRRGGVASGRSCTSERASSELEVARRAAGSAEDAGDEGREPVELADQQRGEGGEGDDLADGDLAARGEQRAGGEDQHHGDGGGGAGQHGSSPHQVSTGYCAARSSSIRPRIACISAARRV